MAGLVFHAPLLRMSAKCLIADDALGQCSYVGLLVWHNYPDGDRSYDVAAQWYHQCSSRPAKILVIAPRLNRLEQLGVVATFEALSRRQLQLRDVPRNAISTMYSDSNDDWATARALKRWLAAHPDDSLALTCDAFRSANLRSALNAVLNPPQSARVRLRPLPDRRFNETNWWKSRDGYKAFGFNWLLGGYRRWVGSSGSSSSDADCDRYEAETLHALPSTLSRADYVMVLNGDENTRPFAAAALMRAGLANQALIADTRPLPHPDELGMPPFHEINRQVLIRRGIDADRVVILPAQATTTYDEARALAAFLDSHPGARVFVVTNDFHLRRSRWIFNRTLGNRVQQIAFVPAPSDGFSLARWWRTEAGFLAVGTEWLKQAFYLANYGDVGLWLAACGAFWLVARRIRQREIACRSA